MRRKWCVAAGLLAVCYCCTLFIGINLLDSEAYRDAYDSRLAGGSFWSGNHRLRSSLCSEHALEQLHYNGSNTCRDKNIVIVGALSFLGSRIAATLAGSGLNIHAAAHDSDITANELFWYRKEQLENSGIHVHFINFSNQTQVHRLIDKHHPSQLVYIPPGIDRDPSHLPEHTLWSKYLKEFVILLENLRTLSPCTRVLLTSLSKNTESQDSHGTVMEAWMDTLELTLSTYHNIYGTAITVLRINGLYGPWSESALDLSFQHNSTKPHPCWYIGDVAKAVHGALQLTTSCEVLDLGHCSILANTSQSNQASFTEYQYTWTLLNITDIQPLDMGIRKTQSWARSYLRRQNTESKDIIFTSYFTTTEDSQRNRKKSPNRFPYMSNWFLSVRDLRMKAVIFHDGMDPQFRHRLIQYYPNISFHYVPSLQNRSTNDARFYAYMSYLEDHTEINRVLLTDVSDVHFQMNPFELVALLGDWLYIGTDIDIFPSMVTMPWISQRLRSCFGNYSVDKGDLHLLMELDTVYNAGVIGGSRHVMLAVLARILEYLDMTPPQLNCNMPAVNYVVHKHFLDRVFTGFPLTSRFLRRQAAPKGVYIVHK